MHVIGTAGHVDHGKSALVLALTGTNPDRLAQEQARGMTLDLGFAHLRFDDGLEAGIVDVPGHERFLRNMLAGAAGMELLLLVVDVNEGVKPQTLEHLAIAQFLNVRRTLVVASKIDLADAAKLDRELAGIRRQLQGTIAAGAALYPVSVRTGEGLDSLRTALHTELAALPARNANAPVYLPIDRVFTLAGRGTIVTGTLMQGRIVAGETYVLQPRGTTAHIRSIGVFGSTRSEVEAGSRVALNLAGLGRDEIARGETIVGRELTACKRFAVRFVPLQSARHLLLRRTPVRAYVGSAELLGTLVIDDSAPLHELRGELRLRAPVVAFSGLRFILRRQTPMTLLGGGYVEGLDAATISNGRDSAEELVLGLLREKGIDGAEPSAIALGANLREEAARAAAERLVERQEAIRLGRPVAYVDAQAAQRLFAAVLAQLDNAHRQEPWAMGMTSIALARAVGVGEPLLVRVLQHFIAEAAVINRGGYYARREHLASLTAEQRAFFEALVPIDESQPLRPIQFAGAAAALKLSKLVGLAKAFETLLAQGTLVKVGDDLYRGTQIEEIRSRVEGHFLRQERMTAAQFRDMIGTSRKYAVPLLEWLDSHGVTIRDGDYRKLRGSGAAATAVVR